jgi:hypothetical protein
MNVPGPRVLFPLALSAFTGLVIALSNHPTQVHAATSPAPLVGFHCANSYGCLSATNTGSGVGINSTSANNSGVAGATSALNAPYATVNLESIPDCRRAVAAIRVSSGRRNIISACSA